MDEVIVREKLESLRRCILRVQDKTPPSPDGLANDLDVQDIVVLNLTRAIQLCVDIGNHLISGMDAEAPATMAGVFGALGDLGVIEPETCEAMTKAVGFRNVAIHNYTAIKWGIVHAICTGSIDDFRRFAKEIVANTSIPRTSVFTKST